MDCNRKYRKKILINAGGGNESCTRGHFGKYLCG